MATKILGKVAMIPKGTWIAGTYNKYECVYHEALNAQYEALKDGVTSEPSGYVDTSDWHLLCRGIGVTTDNNFTNAEKAKVDTAILNTQVNNANGYVGIGSDGKINNTEITSHFSDFKSAKRYALTTAGLQEAINNADGVLYLPEGDWTLGGTGTELLLINKPIVIKGSGHNTRLIITSTVPNTTDVFRISPPTSGTENTFYGIENLCIIPQSGNPARYGINIDVTNSGQYLSKLSLEKLYIGQLGSQGIHLTNPTNTDGFFTSHIYDNFISGGSSFDRIGDSVIFNNNTFTGNNVGIEFSSVVGALQVSIINNNITCNGGAIKINSASQVKIKNNQIELTGTYTGDTDSLIYINDGTLNEIDGNNINAHGNCNYCISLTYANRTKIESNVLQGATLKSIIIDANSWRTMIYPNNQYVNTSGSEMSPNETITNNGVATIGVMIPLTLTNGWTNMDTTNFNSASIKKFIDGTIMFYGVLNGTATTGALTTLPVGLRPAKAVKLIVGGYNPTDGSKNVVLIISITGEITIETAPSTLTRIDLDGRCFDGNY